MLLASNNTTFHGGFPTILHLAHSTLNGGKGGRKRGFFRGGSTKLQLIVGPFLWSKLNEKERNSPSIDNFRNCIRKEDLEAVIDDNVCSEQCRICNFS